eukprot:CAMPEP_0201478918 /NCGR_PEP_ID=MMETSP0151_2-20130828/3677_1 /ASSEMBLY_ACC=CAM_ASM_000257 /TAXON_ID=200890 /ORGANISM="Paramoeba atlantica, Strain 621/1 / CCAP 1560/9" /LENGTH=324 /DNA_ID=CAMNT_0047860179 /DNA_START=42 /DNA_END=1016 /DNA_ORIENTATION=-
MNKLFPAARQGFALFRSSQSPSVVTKSFLGIRSSPLVVSKSFAVRFYNRPSWKAPQQQRQSSNALAIPKDRSSLFYYGVGGAAGLALMGLFTEGKTTSKTLDNGYDSVVRQRIQATYGYISAGLGITAGMATLMFRGGITRYLIGINPWVFLIGSSIATIGSLYMTRSISFYQEPFQKHAMFFVFNSCVALTLAPLGMLGGQLVVKAAAVTGCIVGALSIAGAAAPSETWIQTRGPLSIGLGVVIGASLGQMFFPASSLLASIAMYGGLAVFGGMVFSQTTAIRYHAHQGHYYDPMNHSLSVYLSTINIFTRIIHLLAGNRRKK